jgi:hypothetical protein
MENMKPNHEELGQMDLDLHFGDIRYHYNETIHLQKHLFYHMLAAHETIKVMEKTKIAYYTALSGRNMMFCISGIAM